MPLLQIYQERVVVQQLRKTVVQQENSPTAGSANGEVASGSNDDGFLEFDLTDFAVYIQRNTHHSYELRDL
jgi:hypothetical protein